MCYCKGRYGEKLSNREDQSGGKTPLPRDKKAKAFCRAWFERAPRAGDVHPLQKRDIAAFLRGMPIDFVYGLKRLELRPRTTDAIGKPFGYYSPSEKIIVLYSVPPLEWHFPMKMSEWWFRIHDAEVEILQDTSIVYWKKPVDLAYWMYSEVLLHELGHHYDNQYRHKKKWPYSIRAEEASADRRAVLLEKRNAFSRWSGFANVNFV